MYIKTSGSKVHSGSLFEKREYFGKSREFTFDANKIGDDMEVQILKDGEPLKVYEMKALEEAKTSKEFNNGTGKMVLNFTLKLDSVGVVELTNAFLHQSINKSKEHSEVKYEFVEEPIPKNETQEEET